MRKFYPSLQGVRVVLFMSIFFFHILGFIEKKDILFGVFEYGGWLGVSGFFILSGFLAASQYDEKEKAPQKDTVFSKIKDFLRKYYVFHVIFTIAMMPFAILRLYHGELSVSGFCFSLISQLLLIQSQIPVIGGGLSFNDVSWYLSTMLFITLVSAFVLRALSTLKIKRLVLLLYGTIGIAFLIPTFLIFVHPDETTTAWILYYSFPVRLLDYVVGVIWGLLKKRKVELTKSSKYYALLSIVFLVLTQLSFISIPLELRYAAVYIPALGYLIYYCADNTGFFSRILGTKRLVNVGSMCIYFYFCHYAIAKYLYIIFKKTSCVNIPFWGDTIYIILTLILTYIVGMIMRKVELTFRSRKSEEISYIS
ncbi:acyltransferase family protein [Holdemania massiliensis]|uniref:acyltransferase family protein n=1 Tax=Holdemania massiliensis TaxID=1468449 RepID=UPI001F06046D|nr:acyltransferase [Holdemania massiliensis]